MPILLRFFYVILFGSLLVGLLTTEVTHAQTTVRTLKDSTNKSSTDTLNLDSLAAKSDFKTTIKYSAQDSIIFDVERNTVMMYNSSKIDYGDINLTAERIDINWDRKLITANGIEDTTTGEQKGLPVFKQGDSEYNSTGIAYNYQTRRAIVTGFTTKEGEGFIHSEKAKRIDDDTYYAKDNVYTTCDLPHPHFGIRSKKIKYITQKQIISGPFNLEVASVPTPLGFPFAIVPLPKRRASGIIIPAYGEVRDRGFFLRNGGFYWAISDYMDLTLLGEVYSKGGVGGSVAYRYKKRYFYDGNFLFTLNSRTQGERGTPQFARANDFRLTWSHTPVSRGNSRFSANVNLGTSTFNQRYSFNTQNFLSNTLNSSINFSHNFVGTPFNMSASLRHNQNVQTDITKVVPQASLNMNRLQPFKRFVRKQSSLIGQINFAYNSDFQGEITNLLGAGSGGGSFRQADVPKKDTIGFNLTNMSELLQTFMPAARHSIPISTSGTIARYFTFSPSFNYNETWYFQRYNYSYRNADTVDVDTVRGFSRFYNYSSSVSFTTQVYTTAQFKGKIQAVRHLMTPTISFNYTPDFGKEQYKFFQETQVNARGDVQKLPRYSGLYGSPSQGEVGSISVDLNNSIEMKIRNRDPDEKPKKIALLQGLSFSGNYNFIADSFKLSNINMNARTTLFGKLSVNMNANIDPYTYLFVSLDTATGQARQNRVSQYAWQTGNGIGNLKAAGLAFSYSFNKKDTKKTSEKGSPEQVNEINNNSAQYVDFTLPWQLSISTNLSYSKEGFSKANVTNTVNFNGELLLTPKWKVTFSSGYDFKAKDLSYTTFTIFRDLHCWQMNVTWIPFGPRQSYTLDLGVKAAVLQDLKLSRRNNWYDNR